MQTQDSGLRPQVRARRRRGHPPAPARPWRCRRSERTSSPAAASRLVREHSLDEVRAAMQRRVHERHAIVARRLDVVHERRPRREAELGGHRALRVGQPSPDRAAGTARPRGRPAAAPSLAGATVRGRVPSRSPDWRRCSHPLRPRRSRGVKGPPRGRPASGPVRASQTRSPPARSTAKHVPSRNRAPRRGSGRGRSRRPRGPGPSRPGRRSGSAARPRRGRCRPRPAGRRRSRSAASP